MLGQIYHTLRKRHFADFVSIDNESAVAPHKLRKSYREMQLMVIADMATSPMAYMKPGIMASSLLLRPWTKEQAKEVLKEFFQAYIEQSRSFPVHT